MPLLRIPPDGAGALPQVRERAPLLPGRRLAAGRGAARGDFSLARIGRMDRDTVRGRYDMERLLARLHSGEINLLVGTQMIAKGHDIHGVTLVGVVGCDHSLSHAGFSRGGAGLSIDDAGERAGRARGTAGPRGGADLLPGPLRHCGGQQARLPALLNAS